MPTQSYTEVESYISQPQLRTETDAQYQARQAAVTQAKIKDIAGGTVSQTIAVARAITLTAAAIRHEQDDLLAIQKTQELGLAGVENIQSPGVAIAASIISLGKVAGDVSRATQAPSSALMRNLRSRTGTPYVYDQSDPSTDPPTFIEVVQLPQKLDASTKSTDTKGLRLLRYNDFFITDSQEVDAEKAEVSETFGAPHVFATGRYMRKVMISGVCRTGPVNHRAMDQKYGFDVYPSVASASEEVRARFIVPQTLGLRVLYDKALRASEQISRSLYTRLHIDGEVYSGWFTTLNISRSSNDEGFAHFTMSMLVFGRYHKDEDLASRMVSSVTSQAKNAFDDVAAQATIAAMLGETTLILHGGQGTVMGVVTETNVGTLKFTSPIELEVKGVPQSVSCVAKFNGKLVRGFSIFYGDINSTAILLNGSSPGERRVPLHPQISSIDSLIKTIEEGTGKPLGGKETHHFDVYFSPQTGGKLSELKVGITVDPLRQPKISGIALGLTNQPSRKEYGVDAKAPAREVFTSVGYPLVCRFTLEFFLQTAGGAPLGLNHTQVAALQFDSMDPVKDGVQKADATASASTGIIQTVVKAEVEAASRKGSVTITPPTAILLDSATTRIRITGALDYIQLASDRLVSDLATQNPFASAKDLAVSLRLRLKGIVGYKEVVTPAITITAEYAYGWATNLLAKIIAATRLRTGESLLFSSTVRSITFELSAEGLKHAKSDPEVVRQTIEAIVRSSSFRAYQSDAVVFSSTVLGTGTKELGIDMKNAVVIQSGDTFVACTNAETTTQYTTFAPLVGSIQMEQPTGILGIPGNNLGGSP